jgi:predicted PurR-regulated permease PerM
MQVPCSMAGTTVSRSVVVLLVAATALLAYTMMPIIKELIVAAVLATAVWPAQRSLTARLGGRRGIAAAILTLAITVAGVGAVAAVLIYVVRDGSKGVPLVSEALRSGDVSAFIDRLPGSVQHALHRAIDHVPRDMDELIASLGGDSGAVSSMRNAVTATGAIVVHAALTVIALFFLLARGSELVTWLENASPLGRSRTEELFATFRKVSYSVIVGTGGTAAVQAVTALVGFWIARLPSPVFFAAVTFFCALIPAIGGAAVSLVAALLLLATGHGHAALFLALWALLAVGLVDNLVKPLFLRRGLEIHGAIVFFALIAGVAAFGGIGVLIGPLAISFFLAAVRIYQRDPAAAVETR